MAYGIGSAVTDAAGNVRFAQWSTGQPGPSGTGFMMGDNRNPGKWKSVLDNGVNPTDTGVICEYAASVVDSQYATAFVASKPEGCFIAPCVSLSQTQCSMQPQCTWGFDSAGTGSCRVENWCSRASSAPQCRTLQQCYWSYTNAACMLAPQSVCDTLPKSNCTDGSYPQCAFKAALVPQDQALVVAGGGACTSVGCSVNPTADSCASNPLCRWYDATPTTGACLERLCGYVTRTACWADTKCKWDPAMSRCAPSECAGQDAAGCNAKSPVCAWDTTALTCGYVRCQNAVSSPNDQACLFDTACLIVDGKCTNPDCKRYATQTDCNADPKCFFFVPLQATGQPPQCGAAQCTNNPDSAACGGLVASDACRWQNGKCRQASPEEQVAKVANSCTREVEPNLWWMWLLLAIIFLLLVAIIYRLYLAYAKGLSFFDPPRKNIKFGAEKYKEALFEEAQQDAVETNAPAGLNEL